MRCPFCGTDDTQVKDSRSSEDGASIRRRRLCSSCGSRFTTFERIQLRDLIVIKRDGKKGVFDREKIVKSMEIALRKRKVDNEIIERAQNGIVRQLESSGENEISSDLIGELVMNALSQIDHVAYIRYASVYRNFREASDFGKFVKDEFQEKINFKEIMIKNHQKWMNLALLEALRCKGLTGKNPNVGCVIVKNEKVIGIGRTGSEGRPHAEENSIKSISNKSLLKSSTMYVTLEPCFHKNSKGFSCADLVVQSGIKEIFIGYLDPDPRTSGKSVSFFRKSGIHIDVGLCGEKAKDINAGFNSRITRSLPYITLKV